MVVVLIAITFATSVAQEIKYGAKEVLTLQLLMEVVFMI